MEALARLKNSKGSPRKARLVADLVRGKDVYSALNILRYSANAASPKIEKLLESAINNWELKNEGQRAEDNELYVKTITIDGGTIMKRWNPAPFGRAYRIRKRTNHVTIVVDSRNSFENVNEVAAPANTAGDDIEVTDTKE